MNKTKFIKKPSKSVYFIVAFSILSLVLFIAPFLIPDPDSPKWDDQMTSAILKGLSLILSLLMSLIGIILTACYWSKISNFSKTIPFIIPLIFGSMCLYSSVGNPMISSEMNYQGRHDSVRVFFDHGGGGTGFSLKRNETKKHENVGHPTEHYMVTIQDSETHTTILKKEINMMKETHKFGPNRTLYATITDEDIQFEVRDTHNLSSFKP